MRTSPPFPSLLRTPTLTAAATVLAALAACADPSQSTAPSTNPSAQQDPVAARAAAGPSAAKAAAQGTEAAALAAQVEVIPGRYIVVFRNGRSGVSSAAEAQGVESQIQAKVARVRGKLRHSYQYAIKGFAAELDAAAVQSLRADPEVAYVEPDRVVHAVTTQSGVTWGIDRIDQRSLPLSGTYTYNSTGAGVRAYIIDTGILTSHPEFGGRASAVYDAVGDGQNGIDCNGHGTHVAGTVGSSTYGVAKGVYLRAVRVLDCSGSGSNSGVIAGVNWVAQNHISPAVANMSLGGGASQAVDDAVNSLANSGVFLAVAAGNSNADACNTSPARAANTTTVAASDRNDARASFSNYGGCVDLYAPGVNITSTWLNNGTNTISGTSMATPHVTGVAALYKAANGDASYSTIRAWLTNNATANVITGNPSGTANRLLYKAGL